MYLPSKIANTSSYFQVYNDLQIKHLFSVIDTFVFLLQQ